MPYTSSVRQVVTRETVGVVVVMCSSLAAARQGATLVALIMTASGRGQDKRGRRRSAAIPPDEFSRENVDNMWRRNIAAKCELYQ